MVVSRRPRACKQICAQFVSELLLCYYIDAMATSDESLERVYLLRFPTQGVQVCEGNVTLCKSERLSAKWGQLNVTQTSLNCHSKTEIEIVNHFGL